jgi:hypothetical protein
VLWLALASLAADLPDPRAVDAPGRLEREGLPALVAWLVADAPDPALRARRIHDWIATHIAYDEIAWRQHLTVSADPATTLERHQAVCAGYARLFHDMAVLADLEVVSIPGYSRGVVRDVIGEVLPAESNHEWNAVRLDGGWQLVDVTWDAGGLLDGAAWKARYNLDWWDIDPVIFGWTHLPADPAWQLVSGPLSSAAFLAQPHLDARFGRDLGLIAPLARVADVGATTAIRTARQPGVEVSAARFTADGALVPAPVLVDDGGGATRIRVAFPAPGDYLVRLFTHRADEERSLDAATLGFRASAGTSGWLPIQLGAWRADFALASPDLFDGSAAEIVLVLPGVSEASIVAAGAFTPLVRTDAGFTGRLPAGPWKIAIPAAGSPAPGGKKRGGTAWTVILSSPDGAS